MKATGKQSHSRIAWQSTRSIAVALAGAGLWACGGTEPTGDGSGGQGNSVGGARPNTGGSSGSAGTGGNGALGGTGSGTGGVVGSGGSANGGMPANGGSGASGSAGMHAAGTGGTAGSNSGGGGVPAAGTGPGASGGMAGTNGGRDGAGGASGGGGRGSGGASGAAPMAGTGGAGGSGGSTASCPTTVLKSGDSNQTVKVGSSNRTYILHVPSAYKGTAAVPLVVDFHPLGGSGSAESSSSPYKAQTDPEGVITAYPNGLSGPSGGAWNVGPCCVKDVDDVAFAKALVAQVETMACIDTKRVYAVGFSMGGGMSHYLACHAADVFAAVAPASFDLLKENEDDCKPPRPIAEISFRSSNDTVVPYAGGASSVVQGMPVTFLGAVGTFQKWAEINGCTGSPTAEDSNKCQYYTSCSGGVQIGLCTMNSGHAPGNATIGWPFIKKYTLP